MEYLECLASQLVDEIEGIKKYKELHDMSDNQNEKERFARIIEEEKNHYMTIDEMIKSYM